MNDRNEGGTMSFLAGLLLGGLVGAGIGMLVAPETGEKTRAKLREGGEKAVKKGLDAIDDFQKEKVSPAINRVTGEIKSRVNNFRNPEPEAASTARR